MPGHDIIVIGASAGGVSALQELVKRLPGDLPAAAFVVTHLSPDTPSLLPQLLARAGALPVSAAQDGDPIRRGTVCVARPDHHLLVEEQHVRVVRGPKENRHRPAVDTLFRSAALAHGPRVVGVVLTGALSDGTSGLLAIKERGGVAIVQDPDDADFPSMPRSALHAVAVDHTLPLTEIPAVLSRLAREAAGDEPAGSKQMEREVAMAAGAPEDTNTFGHPSTYGCPECGGVLWDVDDKHLIRFRCRVGHAYSAESLLSDQEEGIEEALWAALRALEENATLQTRVAGRLRERRQDAPALRVEERVRTAQRHADQVRRLLSTLEKQVD
jgi:two-component system, chemotaxis family, protein-glutamate methylesterase/glutaminase